MSYKIKVFVYVIIASIIGISGCRKNNAPDAPSMPTTSSYGSMDTSWVDSTTWFYTSAKDAEKENVSCQFDWGDGTVSEWSDYVNSGDIIKMGHKYTQADTYAVKVKSKDIHKNESDWSRVFTLAILTKSAAPESVTISSLVDSSVVNSAVQFTLRAVDPEGDSIRFLIAGTTQGSSVLTTYMVTPYTSSGGSYTTEYPFQNIGTFNVVAIAQDKQGSISKYWSLPHTVVITLPQKPTTPDAPIQVYSYPEKFIHTPYLFYDQVKGETQTITVQFNWGNDSSLSVVGTNQSTPNVLVLAYLPNAYATAGVFNLTANAIDNWGQYSDTSAPLAVTISDNCINYWDTDTCLGMAIYKDTLWVVDWANHQVKMYNTTGVLLGTIGASTLKAPRYVAVDSTCVYVTDASTAFEEIHKVYVFNKNGTVKTSFGGKGSGEGSEGKFYYPTGIAVDTGFIYVVDSFNKRIQKFKKDSGTYVNKWVLSAEALGMKLYDNELYVALHKGDEVQVFSTDGVKKRNIGYNAISAGTELDADGCLSVPCDIAVTPDAVYVVEASHKSNNNRVQKFTKTGTFINRWGEKGSAHGQFNSPQGVVVDDAGNIYIVDTGNSRIQVFRP